MVSTVRMKQLFLFCVSWLFCISVWAQNPKITKLDKDWKFYPGGFEFAETPAISDALWQQVSIPHTWNAEDPFTDDLTYRRGISWYRKHLEIENRDSTKRYELYFKGAFQVTDVYVNGAFAGRHRGGYTAFNFDITDFLKQGDNLIAVMVNSAQNPFIPPLSIGYASYGGIYRDCFLIVQSSLHFNHDKAGAGVYISTPEVSNNQASVEVKSILTNQSTYKRTLKLQHEIRNAANELMLSLTKDTVVNANSNVTVQLSGIVKNPKLWSPEQPTLYHVTSKIIESGKIVDSSENPLGFRWFSFNPDQGFLLNGSKYSLHGTNLHQDKKGKGDALTKADHLRDMQIIKDMGANFIRLAHYPQDPEVLHLADSLGLLIWEEVPVVDYINPDEEFYNNSKNMALEMIQQHYNHPAIVMWGFMNEILLWSKDGYRAQSHETELPYVEKVRKFAVRMDSVVKAADPTRYSTCAMHMSKEYEKYGIAGIAQVNGFNIYNGWYSGDVKEFGPIVDGLHAKNPKQVLFISEYGAGGDSRVNTNHPERFDFSGQYERYFHEHYLRQIKERTFLAGTAVWNQFDFSQPNVGGTINHMNQKGLGNWDRSLKDVYFLYQANWSKKPMVYIASRDWQKRTGFAGETTMLEVYSNLKLITLTVNGKTLPAVKTNEIQKASFSIKLKTGFNKLVASATENGKTTTDTLTIELQNPLSINEHSFNVNVGSNTQFLDAQKTVWSNDQSYEKQNFGYDGGKAQTMSIKQVLLNSGENTPLFYSYREGLKSYKVNLPKGKYQLSLGFMEPEFKTNGQRIFNVLVDGKEVIHELDLVKEAGFSTALIKEYPVELQNSETLTIQFVPVKGQAVLNYISIKKTKK